MITFSNIYKAYATNLTLFGTPSINQNFALKNINLDIKQGEKVAILGRNGAGKTTFLRLIAGSLIPTSGSIDAKGDVYPLMKIGMGINEKFTGYENILSSLVYTGFDYKKGNIKNIIKDIEEFCELGEFLNKPFVYYSLGMRMRLMFAIATAVNPEIFLIDEILGAGDPYFLLKCRERLNNVIKTNNTTLVLVSHSTQQLRQFCDRGIWLKDGEVFLEGDIHDVAAAYDTYIERLGQTCKKAIINKPSDLMDKLDDGKLVYSWGDGSEKVKITEIKKISSNDILNEKDKIEIRIVLHSKIREKKSLRILITFWNKSGERIARLENNLNDLDFTSATNQQVSCTFKNLLPLDSYYTTVSIYSPKSKNIYKENMLKQLYVVSHAIKLQSNIQQLETPNIIPHYWN